MADSSSDCLPKSKIKRDFSKETHRDRKQNSHLNKYYDENDRRHSSAASGPKESHRDSKPDSHDRSDRDAGERKSHYSRSSEDRRVSYKSDEMYRRTSSQSRRYEDDRHDYESKISSFRNPDRFHDKFIGSENRGTVVSNNRFNHRQENDERLVKYNNRNTVSSSEDEFVASLFQKIDYLSNQVDFLTQENEKLRYNRNKNRNDLPQEDIAEVNIAFRDKHLEEKFLPLLQELVSHLIAGKRSIKELQEFCSRPNLSEEQQLRNELPEEDLFAVDNSTVEPFEENTYVPQYNKSFSEILQNEESADEEEKKGKSKKQKFKKTCFNCNGDHMIGECPDKIDYQKVAEARTKLRQRSYTPSVRYHVRGIQESDFKPGVISDELRKAMDLGPDQIPQYIYRMRLIDYPPGWLEEAVVESSGISLYGLDGHDEKEENSENGTQNSNGVQVQYDPRKFIDYPGFNIPLPPKVFDEYLKLGLPPMQPHHMRSYVEQHMSSKSDVCPKRKKKFTVCDSKPSKVQRLEVDMDVVNDSDTGSIEFIPPLPEETPPPPPPETITIDDDDPALPPCDSDSRSGADTPMSDSIMETLAPVVKRFKLEHKDLDPTQKSSPSLKDLEEIKKQLVLELCLESGSSSPAIQDGNLSYPSDVEGEDSTSVNYSSLPDGLINVESSNDVSSFSEGSSASSPAQFPRQLQRTDSQGSRSKFVTLGTPSLSRHSSFQKLPEYDNFSKNVTSHMNFENLPNSTGTYQKMKKVIKKVKEKINSLIQ